MEICFILLNLPFPRGQFASIVNKDFWTNEGFFVVDCSGGVTAAYQLFLLR